ncbi:hypothetical protein [Amycolatopsis sp. M39]|uniref:hypothetical protein n=1 Tax=Amycolatopsis sp. M39 TaxID=1825094 RepID=UPI0007DF9798|nr:hypothetical protein [Amycolatopsis sp. M39]OAP24545.1 hypothetical protein A4R44_04511 [Amycolatopsis sp. M39]
MLAGVNARRELASRKPMTGLALTVRSAIALALLVGCALPTVNAVAALTGQAETIPLTVTSTGVRDTCYDRKTGHRDLICGKNEHLVVDGTYEVGGVQHQARVTGPPGHPEVGDTVPLKIGPVWWHPVFDSTFTAWFMLVFTVPGLLLGAWLAKATYLPRPPRRIRRERKQAERPRLAPPLH